MKLQVVSKMVVVSLTFIAQSQAFAASDFCAPQAAKAAQAIATLNGTVADLVTSTQTRDGRVFLIELSETGVGTDRYSVKTSGGHDCLIISVKSIGQTTGRP